MKYQISFYTKLKKYFVKFDFCSSGDNRFLTLKAPPIICSIRQLKILPLFQKQQIRPCYFMRIVAGRRSSCNIIPYFCRKLGKMSQNLSSAVVLIGALRVNGYKLTVGKETTTAAPILILARCYKSFFHAQQLSMKFIMLIMVKIQHLWVLSR